MTKNVILIAIVLITVKIYSQERNQLTITDTIYKKELFVNNISFERCPGFISGLPCVRYLQYLGKREPKRKYIEVNKKEVYFELTKEDTVVIDLTAHFKIKKIFSHLNICENDLHEMKLMPCEYKKAKWCGQKAIYTNVKYYEGKIEVKTLNEIFYNNIMIGTTEEYMNVILIYN